MTLLNSVIIFIILISLLIATGEVVIIKKNSIFERKVNRAFKKRDLCACYKIVFDNLEDVDKYDYYTYEISNLLNCDGVYNTLLILVDMIFLFEDDEAGLVLLRCLYSVVYKNCNGKYICNIEECTNFLATLKGKMTILVEHLGIEDDFFAKESEGAI